MKKFVYRAQNANGETIDGEVEAGTSGEAAKLLVNQQLFPLSIEDKLSARKFDLESISNRFKRVKAKDKVVFTRQLATLIKAGLTVTKGLNLLTQQIENPKLSDITRDILNQVQGGKSLAEAMREHKDIFSTMYTSIVEAGETSGSLDESLLRLAEQEEKTYEINTKIRNAFIYPAVVLFVLVAVTILMVVFVLPQVGAMYDEVNQPVPFLTAILIGVATAIKSFWFIIFPLLGAMLFGLYIYLKGDSARPWRDKIKLNVPVFKDLIRKLYMARFARTLGTLVNAGVPVLQALEIVRKVMNNIYYNQSLKRIISQVKSGDPLSKPVLKDALFIPLVGQMLQVGEETGGVGDSLNKVAKYYEDEVEQQVKVIQTLIEPATIVLLGIMVIFLIIAVLFPIYNLVSSIR